MRRKSKIQMGTETEFKNYRMNRMTDRYRPAQITTETIVTTETIEIFI